MLEQFCYLIDLMVFQVLFQINKRPEFETMKNAGIRVNNKNQSLVQYIGQQYSRQDRDKLYYMGIMPIKEVNKTNYNILQHYTTAVRHVL